jgi:hypothetical protein
METKINANKVLYNKLNNYFKDNIKLSFKMRRNLIIITEEDLFYCINIYNENISSFIINNDNSVIESMIIKDLCFKKIIDINISISCEICSARNCDRNVYFLNFENGKLKKYILNEKIIDMCCGVWHSVLLTQSGKVYEFNYLKEKSITTVGLEIKYFQNDKSENESIVMISCGFVHSLALTESGRVFGWVHNHNEQFGANNSDIIEPNIIDMNDIKIKKISCGSAHSLLLSCDGDIYAFGSNNWGEVGNGTKINQKFPIKLDLNNKLIDIESHSYYCISMSVSEEFIYYVWGRFEKSYVSSPRPTKYESFEEILNSDDKIDCIKTNGDLIEFEDSFVRNGYYNQMFEEIKELGFGSFGTVFEAKNRKRKGFSAKKKRKDNDSYGIKKIRFSLENKNEIIREYLNYSIMKKNYSENKHLVKHFNAWFEESLDLYDSGISLYIQMELCDKSLEDVINEFIKDSKLKTIESLTTLGYYIATQIFIGILKGVNHLHKQNPSLIHRDLKPVNILLKKDFYKGFCVKIADFGLMAIHHYSEQSHTLDKGTPKYMAPEVIDNKKYNTKADVYSLGIVFKNLFDFTTEE